MKNERKLLLVPPPADAAAPAPEDLPTEAEARAADTTRRALEDGTHDVARELLAAIGRGELSDDDHDAILARVLDGDESRAPSAERAEAERLRLALEGQSEHESAHVARMLHAAHSPSALDPARNELLVTAALARAKRAPSGLRRALPRTMAVVTSALALAAGAVLLFSSADHVASPPSASRPDAPVAAAAAAALIPSRSTDDLFDRATPFPRQGGETARIDRIASARASDLRSNRFARWGVK